MGHRSQPKYQVLADLICREMDMPPLSVRRVPLAHGWARGIYVPRSNSGAPPYINISPMRAPNTLLHELAHHLEHHRNGVGSDHGAPFAAAMTELVNKFGPTVTNALA